MSEIQKFLEEREKKWQKIETELTRQERAAFNGQTARMMSERVANFRGALNDPDQRIGEKRAQRKPNPDFVAPEKKTVNRFDQLDKKDRWSSTEYQGTDTDGRAAITVQDPRDPDDLVCSPISDQPKSTQHVGGEEEREVHPEKISQLQGGEEGELRDWERSAKDLISKLSKFSLRAK